MIDNETIYALATPHGRSAIAVFRISGKNCIKIIKKITKIKQIKTKKTVITNIYSDKKKIEIIDNAIIIFFKSPKSYTGEDLLEISIHGGTSIIACMNKLLISTNLCRIAEPGEFTKRAFLNNKIDLLQAESVIDLINAETNEQRKQALNQLRGKFGSKIKKLLNEIKKILANYETMIDFSDEEIPSNLLTITKEQTVNIINKIKIILNDNEFGEKIRQGFNISILGAPNTGKSSLINYLAKENVAIVSKIPGTTRDIIELKYDLNGIPVSFFDTAGLRNDAKSIEKIGINMAIKKSKKSSINLVIIDKVTEIKPYKKQFKNIIFVRSKSDIRSNYLKDNEIINISSKNGLGISNLLKKIHDSISKKNLSNSGNYISRERHRQLIEKTLENLQRSQNLDGIDMAAEEIRQSLSNLSKITGKFEVDEILGIIFKDFCIGK